MKYNSTSTQERVSIIVKETSLNSERRRLKLYKDKIPCKIGCSHCCSRPVTITLAEASVIVTYLSKSKKWEEVKSRISKLKELEKVDAATWFKMGTKCPILDPKSNKCLAYEVRPITCSTHFVSSDPSSCDPWSFEPVEFKSIDLVDLFEKAMKEINKICGKNHWSVSIIIHRALEMSEKLMSLSGLSLDQVIVLISREN